MLFSVGNLVTLVIVVAMFGAYHLLTADNRSLEKLKRMGEKLKAELGSYVESKSEEIQHYGIDLDVQQKAAKVVLEKIQEAQGAIDEKADSITEIANRFKDYDSILAQLMDMTKRVDQNIAHLAEKNDYIETLAKRLESAGKKMDSIEAEMPKIKEQFALDAKQILDGFRDDILDQLRERLTEIVDTFEHSRSDAQTAIERASSLRDQIDAITASSLETAASRARSIEDAAFSTLRNHIAAGFEDLSRQTDDRLASVAQQLELASQKSETALSALTSTAASQISDTERRLAEAKAALNAISAEMARVQKETAEASAALVAKFKSERGALEEQFAQFGEAFETHRASFEKEFLGEITSLRTMLDETKSRTGELTAAAEGNVSEAFASFEQTVNAELEARVRAMDEQIDAWLSSMDAKIRKVSQDALEQRRAEEARLAQEMSVELKRIKDNLYTQTQKFERDIEAFKNV